MNQRKPRAEDYDLNELAPHNTYNGISPVVYSGSPEIAVGLWNAAHTVEPDAQISPFLALIGREPQGWRVIEHIPPFWNDEGWSDITTTEDMRDFALNEFADPLAAWVADQGGNEMGFSELLLQLFRDSVTYQDGKLKKT